MIADGAVKTKVKASDFRFKPVKGWLGGEYREKLGGWRARVFEVWCEPYLEPSCNTIVTPNLNPKPTPEARDMISLSLRA